MSAVLANQCKVGLAYYSRHGHAQHADNADIGSLRVTRFARARTTSRFVVGRTAPIMREKVHLLACRPGLAAPHHTKVRAPIATTPSR